MHFLDIDGVFDQYYPAFGTVQSVKPLSDPKDITIVTAFFDIGRGDWGQKPTHVSPVFNRTTETYLRYFEHLSKIRNQIIVYVDKNLANTVIEMRREAGLENRTIVFVAEDLFSHPNLARVRSAIASKMTNDFRKYVWRPDVPECNSPEYILVNLLKSYFVCNAISRRIVLAHQIAWIDFGYCRNNSRFDPTLEWQFDAKDHINLFFIRPLDSQPVYEVVKSGDVYFQGCHILGPARRWPDFRRELEDSFIALLECDLIDDDQTLLLMAWRRDPSSYIIHAVDPIDWHIVFNRFNSRQPLQSANVYPPKLRRTPQWLREIKLALRRWN